MRDRILDATERLLGRLGYQKTTMDDVAREAAIGRRTIYLHFATKEEMALATIDRIVERLMRTMREIAASDRSPGDRLRAMLSMRVLYRFDSVRDYYQGIDEIFRSLRPAYMARRVRYFAEEASLFAEVLEGGREAGVFRFEDAETTAHLLLLATNSLLPSSLSMKELGERREVEARVAGIADLLIDGLRPSPVSPSEPEGRRAAPAATSRGAPNSSGRHIISEG